MVCAAAMESESYTGEARSVRSFPHRKSYTGELRKTVRNDGAFAEWSTMEQAAANFKMNL